MSLKIYIVGNEKIIFCTMSRLVNLRLDFVDIRVYIWPVYIKLYSHDRC